MKWLIIFPCTAIILCGQASPTNPIAPRSVPSGVRPTPTGSVINVHSGNDLQAIYNAAACGSDIVIDDGAVFTGSYVFNKQCAAPNWILVEGTGCANGTTPIPTYVTQAAANSASVPPWPAPSLTHYATINSSAGAPPLSTSNSSFVPGKFNYFGCLEVTSSVFQFLLVETSNSNLETLTSQLADHIMFDRLYVHSAHASSTVQAGKGFLLVGSNLSVVNSYVSEIYYSESQAILISFGPGPILIQNNFLSAASETVLAGGTGKSPGYSCTVAPSPAPTTTTATVNTCINAASGAVATPPIGTQVMFYTSSSSPVYLPSDWTTITGNISGALTFNAIHAAPIAGAAKVAWGILPADITLTKNYFYKLPSWNSSDPSYDGIARLVKNFIESKYGQRWKINGNVFVNHWNAGQQYAFNFNSTDQNGDCPWCFSSDISLTNNIIKNIAADFVVIGTQAGGSIGACPSLLNRVLIQNNLFFAKGAAPYISGADQNFALVRNNGGCAYTQQKAVDSLQIIHNTMLGSKYNGQLSDDWPLNFSNLVIKDNITEFDQTRWFYAAGGCTEPCFTSGSTTSGTWTASNNAIINSGAINGGSGISDSTITSRYGSMVLSTYYDTSLASNYSGAPFLNYSAVNTDYHNFALTGSGPWRNAASDGTDPGVNFTTLDAAIGGVSTLACDLNSDGVISVLDVQLAVNMSLGLTPCTANINGPGVCAVTTIQRVVNAALGGTCVTGP